MDAISAAAAAAAGPADGETVSGDIPFSHLLVSFGVIVVESYCARLLELGNADQLLISGIRAFLQLSFLGFILHPIFAASNPGIVFGYIFGFMIMVSAYEATARPKIAYPGMLKCAMASLGLSLLGTGTLLLLIVTPDPWYNAQYLIPLAGMLINNSLSGVALALNQMMDHLTNSKEHVEVLLAFGASPWEAAWPGFIKSAQAALIPAINGMNVIGLVSIPGMMTGQILGGASPVKAARYQIVITFLISACTFSSVALICALTIRAVFDERGRHATDRMVKQSRLDIGKLLDPKRCFGFGAKAEPAAGKGAAAGAGAVPLLDGEVGLPRGTLRLRGAPAPAPGEPVLALDIAGVVAKQRPFEAKLSLGVGEAACIMGPSGIGKSTLLKWVSDLQTATASSMQLRGKSSTEMPAQAWRRDVLYVHQSKAPLPGTPLELVRAVEGLKVNKGRPPLDPKPHMRALGLSEGFLEQAWGELSGGEAQRMMVAVALSTRPAVILLDEPTSALDDASKGLVEAALLEVLRSDVGPSAALLVTHDKAQAERLGFSVCEVEEVRS